MFYWGKWILGVTIVLGLAMLIPVAQAEEPIDFTQYTSCTETNVSQDKEFSFGSFECTGITRSNQENKLFENMSFQNIAIFRLVEGQNTQYSYAKYLDRNGDFVIMEFSESGSIGRQEGTWKILYGTGKWKGIKGSGKHVHVGWGRPIKPGTYQNYTRNTGTIELPK